jgi:hypothetical protein
LLSRYVQTSGTQNLSNLVPPCSYVPVRIQNNAQACVGSLDGNGKSLKEPIEASGRRDERSWLDGMVPVEPVSPHQVYDGMLVVWALDKEPVRTVRLRRDQRTSI